MRLKNGTYILKLMVVGILLTYPVVIGFNCAPGFKGATDDSSGSGGVLGTIATPGAHVDLPVGLLTAEQLLKSMISVTGIQGANDASDPYDAAIMTAYNARYGSLPVEKFVDKINGPMLIAVTNIASAICNKLVHNESLISDANASSRLFFREISFSSGLNQMNSSTVVPIASRLARSFWGGRDLTANEVQILNDTMLGEYLAASDLSPSNVTETNNFSVALCTGMLSSFDSLVY